MKRILIVLFATIGWLAIPGMANAAPVNTANCVAHYDWHTGTHFPALERYVVADWETQCSPPISMQLKIGCQNVVIGTIYTVKSGIVTALEKDDETHCGFDDAGLFSAIRFNGGPWKTLCAPCSGWRKQ